MSAIPRQVKKQAEEATRIFEELQKQRNGDAPPESAPEAAPAADEPRGEAQPASTPEAAPAAPEQPSQPAAAEQPAAPPPQPQQPDSWEQKYRVLTGKYNAEVPALHRRIGDLETIIAAMQNKPAETQQPDPVPVAIDKLVKPEEITDYGVDFMDVVGRRAQEAVAPTLKQLVEKLSKLEATVGTTSQKVEKTEREKVYDQLDGTIENWRAINSSPEFIAWLNDVDVFTGTPRMQALREAFDRNEAHRVVGIFRKYLQENTVTMPTSQPTAATPERAPAVQRETLAAPSRSRTVGTDAPRNAKIWTEREIAAFYEKVRRRQVSADERARVEADIMRAAAENRIR